MIGDVTAWTGGRPLLEVKDVHKSFGGVRALRGVSLEVRPGEVHALLGENGAGKSTLVKILAGAERPDSGTLVWEGESLSQMTPREAQERGLAVVHQEFSLVPDLSVLDNLFLGREPRQKRALVDRAAESRLARRLEERMGVPLELDSPVATLSVAERQRVEIARALTFDANLIIMDEPSAVLAGHELEHLFRIVRALRDQGVAVIYISHRLVEIGHLADRVTVLKDGAYIATRDVADVDEQELIRLMVGRDLQPLAARITARGEVLVDVQDLRLHPTTKPFSFQVRAGEVVGLAGLVGSGRTTVADTLAGLFKPDAGVIRRNGRPVRLPTPRHAMRERIAVIPEDRRQDGILLPVSIRENIGLPNMDRVTRWGVVSRRRELALSTRMVKDLDIRTPTVNRAAGLLSGGNQQKVVLGKWLARDPVPEVFILDEPTRGVDIGAKAEVYRLIARLAENGAAVLLISSELPEVLTCSHRILVMRDGTLAGELSAEAATEETIMQLAVGDDGRGDDSEDDE